MKKCQTRSWLSGFLVSRLPIAILNAKVSNSLVREQFVWVWEFANKRCFRGVLSAFLVT